MKYSSALWRTDINFLNVVYINTDKSSTNFNVMENCEKFRDCSHKSLCEFRKQFRFITNISHTNLPSLVCVFFCRRFNCRQFHLDGVFTLS